MTNLDLPDEFYVSIFELEDEELDDFDGEENDTPEVMSWSEAYEFFNEYLNESNPTVSLCGYDYDPDLALRLIDPIAYGYEFTVWADAQNIDTDKLTGVDREGH